MMHHTKDQYLLDGRNVPHHKVLCTPLGMTHLHETSEALYVRGRALGASHLPAPGEHPPKVQPIKAIDGEDVRGVLHKPEGGAAGGDNSSGAHRSAQVNFGLPAQSLTGKSLNCVSVCVGVCA